MRVGRPIGAVAIAALISSCSTTAQIVPTEPEQVALSGDIVPAHDPVLIRENDTYYSYSTGMDNRKPILARSSTDLATWHALPGPLDFIPDWALHMVPGARDIWAPDIAKVGDRYRLYYSVSTFGSQHSVIGLATTATLDPASRGYGWRDEGEVIASSSSVDFNAIDPNFFSDADGRDWLTFGSFWTGIKLVELDQTTGKPKAGAPIRALASRGPEHGTAIEAPFLFHRNGWYYLLVSFDQCCRGADSTYKLAIGRSRSVSGPYLDRAGTPMLEGGGSIVLEAGPDDRFRGPGHAAYFRDSDGREYLIHHAYDRDNHGVRSLRLERLGWTADGWPKAAIDSGGVQP